MDSPGKSFPCPPPSFCWDNWPSFFDGITNFYDFLCCGNCQCNSDISGHLFSGSRGVLGSFVYLFDSHLPWGAICCYISHFNCNNFSNYYCFHSCRLDWILVYCGASNKEEHLSCKEFFEHNSVSIFISFLHSTHHMNQSYD